MSNTYVHKPVRFVAPEKDVVDSGYKHHVYIKNWKREYNKHYSRIPEVQKLRKRLNKRERAIVRDDLHAMTLDPELFEDYTPPARVVTLYYLD